MKKTAATVIVLFVVLASVFAWQTTYTQGSDEVKTFYILRRLSGTPTAEPVYPVSASQLLAMVETLDVSRFGSYEMSLYKDLVSKLAEPTVLYNIKDMSIDCDMPLLISGFYKRVDPVFYRIADQKNLASLNIKFNFTEHFATEFDLNVSNWKHSKPTDSVFTAYSIWRANDLDLTMPVKAYGSFGSDYFNIIAGRDRVSTDNAVTGNLTLNENFAQEDFVKLSFVKEKVSYDWTLISFDNAVDIDVDFANPRKYVINHKFSVALLNHLTLSADEGAVIYTDNILGDPQIVNPFMLIHNFFTFQSGNTNNFFSLDATFNSKIGIEANVQYLFDQIMNSFETESSGANASAVLLNTKYSKALGNGILTAYLEGVYVSQGCYLKADSQSYNRDPEPKYDNEKVDLVIDFTSPRLGYAVLEKDYLGYPYGSDCKAVGLGAAYLYKGQNFKFDLFFLDKGPYGALANEQRDSAEPVESQYKNNMTMFKVCFGADGTLFKGISYDCAFNLNFFKNKDHVANHNPTAPEFKICITVDPLAFAKRHTM